MPTSFLTRCLGAAAAAALVVSIAGAEDGADSRLAGARTLLLTGRYGEALATYRSLGAPRGLAAAIGAARCQRAMGDRDGAFATLRSAAQANPASALPRAELAELEFERGAYAAVQALVDSSLALDPELCAARYLAAELHRVAGRLEQASDAYRWLVRYYNREQKNIRDPETLRWIGLAGAEFARWNRSSSQFHFLVNDLYPDALARDSLYWPAHLEMARLFLEKFNRPEALAEVAAALRTNPRAAEAHAARAQIALQQFELDSAQTAIGRALAIDPDLLIARQLLADVRMVTAGPREAIPILEQARALDPVDDETLGRLAAAYGVSDGLRDDGAGTRMGKVIAEVVRRNERAGTFFAALAAGLDRVQRYPAAARYYEEARRRMPQLIGVPGPLGLCYMRLAEEDSARTILKEAFEMDPFNVRVKNSLRVLELLETYGTIETRHFVIRFDPARDSLLARYAARRLEEEIYPEVVKALGHAPAGKSLFQIFGRAKGTNGHGWFSARMVGLPFIGTVGACAGRVVAITSPNDGQRFNWARVLRHEFVHLVNFHQTDFGIARWYTEALAVRLEGSGRPRVWGQVLERRVAADSLFDLDSINLGFVRPSSGEDWLLAYQQADLYARYVAETYGEAGLGRLVAAYADHLDTRTALRRCFSVTQEAFEKGYRTFLGRIAGGRESEDPPPKPAASGLTDLERAVERQPRSLEALETLARALLERRDVARAKQIAERALAIDPKSQTAAYVLARALAAEGGKARALEVLRAAFDPARPSAEALAFQANLALDADSLAEAEKLALLGQERFPYAADWERGLAKVYRANGDHGQLARTLERAAAFAHDDLEIRKELAGLAAERREPKTAARWANEALDIDVTDAASHAALAAALAESGESGGAIDEYQVAIGLAPAKLEWLMALAKACVAAGDRPRARSALEELLRRDAAYPEARQMLDALAP